jgi:hypothetical protein
MTKEQRQAAAHAKLDVGLTGPEVARQARAGHLKWEGAFVGPFEIDPDYVRKLAYKLNQERKGKVPSQLASLPPRDATEALRVRLVNMADAELAKLEREAVGKRDLTRLRDVVKCVKEAASIAAPKEPQTRPGHQERGVREAGHAPRHGHTGALLAAMRGGRTSQSGEGQNGEGPHDGGPSDAADAA